MGQVMEITRPVDLVLHNVRAEFDQQLAEEALIEQFRMERERQQKIAEEEEIRRLRMEYIPKAQPMPYFDRPFIPRRVRPPHQEEFTDYRASLGSDFKEELSIKTDGGIKIKEFK